MLDSAPLQKYLPGIRCLQSGDDPQGRRLATPGIAKDDQTLPFENRETDAVKHLLPAEPLAQPEDLQCSPSIPSLLCLFRVFSHRHISVSSTTRLHYAGHIVHQPQCNRPSLPLVSIIIENMAKETNARTAAIAFAPSISPSLNFVKI